MTKQKVSRRKKVDPTRVKKKAKAGQIIKQKVVINLDKRVGRTRRSRPLGSTKNSINKPQSVPTVMRYPVYDQVRASYPYIQEISSQLKALKADKDTEEKRQLGMQQQALLMQMLQQQQHQQGDEAINQPKIQYEELEEDAPEEVVNMRQQEAQLAISKAELKKKQAEARLKQLAEAREMRQKSIKAERHFEEKQKEKAMKEKEAVFEALQQNRQEGIDKTTRAERHFEEKQQEKAFKALKQNQQDAIEREAIRRANEEERLAKAKAKKERAEAEAKAKAEAEALKAAAQFQQPKPSPKKGTKRSKKKNK